MLIDTVRPVRVSHRTLRSQYDAFLRSLRRKRPETRGTYERALREFLRWFERDRSFRFRVTDVRRYKTYLAARKHLSAVSVCTYLTAVRSFFRFLVRAGIIRENPAEQVQGSRRSRLHSREAISPEEVRTLLASIDPGDERGLRDLAIVNLMVGCALSVIEVVRADVGDLHEDGQGLLLAVQGKGRVAKDDEVVIPPGVRTAIARYLAARGVPSSREPLFTSAGNRARGTRMTTRAVRERVDGHLMQAGIKNGSRNNVTPASLRHTAAMMLARSGATAEEIKTRMRLGSAVTAKLYVNELHRAATRPE